MFKRALALTVLLLAVLGVQLTSGGQAFAAVRTLYYDASQAQEFVTVVNQAATLWNGRVTSVRLAPVPAGRTPNIRVYADNGWPRTYSSSLGNGYWYMGRQAVDQGYYRLRIATHEFGHILGLPDNRTGLCSDLMSGSSAPVSCTNAYPSSAEASRVQRNFGGTLAPPAAVPATVY
jgi:snapalysin